MSTGAFRALKRRYPAAAITVLASERNKDIIKNDPHVEEVLVYKGLRQFVKELKTREIDLGIDLFYGYELKPAFLTYLSGAKYRLGFENFAREVFFNIKGPRISGSGSMLKHLLDLVEYLGADTKDCLPKLYLLEEEINWSKSFLLSLGIEPKDLKVAIHPGGFYPAQRWPADRFAAVAARLIEKWLIKPILLGDKSEEELLRGIRRETGKDGIIMLHELNLRQAISLLSQCNLLICNNSGILHIACALGVPTVSTMGPTDSFLWQPIGENHIVLKKDLPCSPCSRSTCARQGCLNLITIQDAMQAIEAQLEKIRKD